MGTSRQPTPRGKSSLARLDSAVERLIELRERLGVSYLSVGADDADAFAPVMARLKGR